MYKSILDGLEWLRSPYAFLDKALERGELSFRMRLPGVGSGLITGEPELISQIVRDKNLIGGRGTKALRPVVGDHSLIVLEGEQHERHRNLMLPHFFSGNLGGHDALTRKWVRHAVERLPPGGQFSGTEFVSGITLNIILEVLFGALPQATHERAVAIVRRWLASFTNPAVLFLKPLQVNLGKLSPWGRFLSRRAELNHFIRDLLPQPASAGQRGGVLAALQQQRSDGTVDMTDEQLISQMVTFLMFGHDTSAAQMGWFFHHTWRDATALREIEDEIAGCSGQAGGAPVDPEQLLLLRSALQESMRLTPVVVHLTRHAIAPTTIGSFAVAAGERVMPCMYLAHRNPAVFEQPARFMARRFLTPAPDWSHAYFPFGLGHRLCAGMPFALRQMILIAAELISSCKLEPASIEPVRPVRNMVLIVPCGGPRMRRVP